MKWTTRLGALGVSALLAVPAFGADFGGNCCADLEERIAELEATVAKKGNRKVSLTISGWVAQQVTYWDDGTESNLYVHGLGRTLSTHVRFSGQAKINNDWSAGYVLKVEVVDGDSLSISQVNDDGDMAVEVRESYWFLRSKQLGRLSVGTQSMAADNAALMVDRSGSVVAANWVLFDSNNFALNVTGFGPTPLTWGHAGDCRGFGGSGGDCAGVPMQGVKYETPSLAGFTLSASWGEDDYWDVAARYAGEFGGFKIAAAAAYAHTNDVDHSTTSVDLSALAGFPVSLQVFHDDLTYIQAGLYLEHISSGLFGLVNYGNLEGDISGFGATILGVALGPFPFALETQDTETWYGKAGIRANLNSLGKTVFYGEYMRVENPELLHQLSVNFGNGSDVTTQMYGAGLVQHIDSAAMQVWLKYRHLETDVDDAFAGVDVEDADFVGVGGLIQF